LGLTSPRKHPQAKSAHNLLIHWVAWSSSCWLSTRTMPVRAKSSPACKSGITRD